MYLARIGALVVGPVFFERIKAGDEIPITEGTIELQLGRCLIGKTGLGER